MKKVSLIATLIFILSLQNAVAQDEYKADCLILDDENSIICKYLFPAKDTDATVEVKWIDPNGEISRTRQLEIPKEHISVYDFRYLEGRIPGIWKFEVLDGEKTTVTQFEINEKE